MTRRLKQLVLAGGCLGTVVLAVFAAEKSSGKVWFKNKDTVVIYPGTNISAEDEKSLNDVLKSYDKSVYKIRTGQDRKTRTKGRLSELYIDGRALADADKAQASGVSIKTIQIVGLTPTSVTRVPPAEAAGSPTSVNRTPETSGTPTSVNSNKPRSPTSVTRVPPPGGTPSGKIPSGTPSSVNAPPKISEKEADELVERIKPILKKYCK